MSNITRSTPIEISGDDNEKSNQYSSIIFGKKVNMLLVFCGIVAIICVIFVNCVLNIHNVIHSNRTYKKRMRLFYSIYILDVLFNFQSLIFKHKDDNLLYVLTLSYSIQRWLMTILALFFLERKYKYDKVIMMKNQVLYFIITAMGIFCRFEYLLLLPFKINTVSTIYEIIYHGKNIIVNENDVVFTTKNDGFQYIQKFERYKDVMINLRIPGIEFCIVSYYFCLSKVLLITCKVAHFLEIRGERSNISCLFALLESSFNIIFSIIVFTINTKIFLSRRIETVLGKIRVTDEILIVSQQNSINSEKYYDNDGSVVNSEYSDYTAKLSSHPTFNNMVNDIEKKILKKSITSSNSIKELKSASSNESEELPISHTQAISLLNKYSNKKRSKIVKT